MRRYLKKPACQLLKRDTYRTMRWRNGRGSTLEIAREPASGEEFAWRLSLADIEQDGEFSAYPGYRRALVLVSGKRLQLRFNGHGNCSLDPARRGVRFEGEWKSHCAVPQGRCTDLSLIVRIGSAARPAAIVRAPVVLNLKSTRRVVLSRELYGALFVLDGSAAVAESTTARRRIVRAQDTLLLSPGAERILTLQSRERSPAQLVLLRWRPGRQDDQTSAHTP